MASVSDLINWLQALASALIEMVHRYVNIDWAESIHNMHEDLGGGAFSICRLEQVSWLRYRNDCQENNNSNTKWPE